MLSSTISELRCDDFSTEVWCWQGQFPLHEERSGVTFDLRVHDCRQSWEPDSDSWRTNLLFDLLEPIRRPWLLSEIIARLHRLIVEGSLELGDRLSSE